MISFTHKDQNRHLYTNHNYFYIKMNVIYLFCIRLYHSSGFYFPFTSLFNSYTIIIQILHELKESQFIK